jgi:hypothetical protein
MTHFIKRTVQANDTQTADDTEANLNTSSVDRASTAPCPVSTSGAGLYQVLSNSHSFDTSNPYVSLQFIYKEHCNTIGFHRRLPLYMAMSK